jgi:hypothetical protein
MLIIRSGDSTPELTIVGEPAQVIGAGITLTSSSVKGTDLS